MNNELTNELADLSGERELKRPSKFTVPTVRLNGQTGKFTRNDITKTGNSITIDLPNQTLSGVILKVRRTLAEFKKTERLFTNEHDNWRSKIILFQAEPKTGKVTRIKEGTNEEIRKEYQGLKAVQNIYFLLDEEIVKLVVKGSGLGKFYQYINELEQDKHIFEHETIIGLTKEEGQLGTYFVMTFVKGKDINLEEIAPKIKEVATKLRAIENFYQRTSTQDIPPIQTYEEHEQVLNSDDIDINTEDDIPIIGEENKESEVNIEDIPF